ncbi:MAG: hypothetical protein GY941_27930 [Planctomycetes bacterium]|nr:hypothetical protein [Planctomycetota bacterium]
MTFTDYIAICALVVSTISICISAYNVFYDSPRLSASAKYYPGHEDDEPQIQIKVVNKGKRPAILRSFGGPLETGGWEAEHLGESDHGLRLSENGFYERTIYRDDVYTSNPNIDSRFVAFWFEDSLGRRHEVKGSGESVTALLRACGDLYEPN